jgi:hypothetical protein
MLMRGRMSRPWMRVVTVAALVLGGLTLPATPASAATCQSSCDKKLAYFGGYVQKHPKIYLIFWGPKWNSDSNHVTIKNALIGMFSKLAGTAYNNILVQYTQSSISSDPNAYIHNDVAYGGSWVDTDDPNAGGINVGLGSAADEVRLGAFNAVPAWQTAWQNDNNDPNFMIFPQQGASYDGITMGGACAIHNNDLLELLGVNLNYSVVRYGSDPTCGAGSALSDIRSEMTRATTHEYAETATNPTGVDLQSGGNSWHTTDPQPNPFTSPPEIADLCGPDQGIEYDSLIGEYTTFLWSDAAGGIGSCVGLMGEDNSMLAVCTGGMASHTVYGDFQSLYDLPASGGEASMQSKLGCPTSERLPFQGGYRQTFSAGGAIYKSSSTGVHEVHGAIYSLYHAKFEPGISGNLGFPTSNEQNAPGGGRQNTFAGASCGNGSVILWSSATGAHEMHGCLYKAFLTQWGGPGGAYGYPTSDEQATPGAMGRVNYMSGSPCGSSHASGLYFSSGTGKTWPVHGCIYQKYKSIGEDNSGLGLPTSDEIAVTGGVQQNFTNGNIRDIGGTITVNISGSGTCTDYGPATAGPNGCVGFYTTSAWFSGGGVGLKGQEIWTYANGTVKDSTANYTLTGLDVTRVMQLQAYIPNNYSNASHAHYHYCSPGGGCADGYVNQNNYTNQWAVFGSVCTTDGTATIQLADDGGDVSPVKVGADAIRAVRTNFLC